MAFNKEVPGPIHIHRASTGHFAGDLRLSMCRNRNKDGMTDGAYSKS